MAGGPSTRKRNATQIEGTTPNTERRRLNLRRKKQGVTKTNSAAVKALIQQNQVNSPLLKLAPEIREKILTYLVGDQVLHLHYSDASMFRFDELEEDTWSNKPKPASILYHICQADTSRAHAYDQALDSVVAEAPVEDSAPYYVENPNKRHRFCRHLATIKEETHSFHLSLNVLGACRQLYEEANHLLWSTNTFTFSQPRAFELFFSSLNPAQKRNLTKLAFFDSMDTAPGGWEFPWEKAFRPANLKMLQGLTALSLCFEQRINRWDLAKFANCQEMKSRFRESMEGFVQFRMLPLKQVCVTISDDVTWLVFEGCLEGLNGDLKGRWTAIQKNQFAQEWEEKLLDVDPAATIEAEEDAAEVDARVTSNQYWADALETAQHDAIRREAKTDAAVASLKEAELEPARISSSMQTGIEYVIKEREAIAMNTRTMAVTALKRVEDLKIASSLCIERDAAARKSDREARKRRQVIIKSRSNAPTKPTPY